MNDSHDFKPNETSSRGSLDPLHGMTLEIIIKRMVHRHGWDDLADRIPVRCFQFEPSIKSSLTFLRKTPWARKKLEDWYAYDARRFDMSTPEEAKAEAEVAPSSEDLNPNKD